MKIGELAARTQCDVQTIRYYEREGLLEAPERDASGYRRYADRHLQRMQFIRHCRSLAVPLSDVRRLLAFAAAPERSCGDVDQMLDGHIAEVQRQRKALMSLERQLVALRKRCDGDASHPCAILESFRTSPADNACACHAAR